MPYINRLTQHFVEEYISNAAKTFPASDENIAIVTRVYRCSIVGLLLDWLDAGMDYDAVGLSQKICVLFGGAGKSALSRRIE